MNEAPERIPGSWPVYRALGPGDLEARVRRARDELSACRACPRDCGVDRMKDAWSACKTGRYAVVSSSFPHFGEEDCLRGRRGSGTIFFAHCNLRCVFCQNFDISQAVRPGPAAAGLPPEGIAAMMLQLQARGCHNINLVTPEHVAPQIVEALAAAIPAGLRLPVVYNTSAYDAASSLDLMDGLVDIYMPDFKLWSGERSARYLRAPDYPEVARAAIQAMHRQVGPLILDGDGLARRGLLIRHLLMPGCLEDTKAILGWIARTLGPQTGVNLMDQYRPAGRVGGGRHAGIDRRPSTAELQEARATARDLGLRPIGERASRA